MVRMIRSKKKFVCTKCKAEAIKWSGYCASCKAAGTMQEHIIIPVKVSKEKPTAKAVRSRWKRKERDAARHMTDVDGPDPMYRNIASSTGKVGHITALQVDAVSLNYATEVKNRTLPAWLNIAWIQIQQRAIDLSKHALLHIEPSNIARDFPINGVRRKTEPMAIITQSRHDSLIITEKHLQYVQAVIDSEDTNLVKIRKIRELLGR